MAPKPLWYSQHQDDLETPQNPPFPPTNEVQTDQSEHPELDVYGVPVTQDEKPPRVTRSGRAYLSILKNVVHVCQPDLCKPLETIDPTLPSQSGPTPSKVIEPSFSTASLPITTPPSVPSLQNQAVQESPGHTLQSQGLQSPGHTVQNPANLVHLEPQDQVNTTKSLKFSAHREVRLYMKDTAPTDETKTFHQVCSKVQDHRATLRKRTYVMTNVVGLDISLQEVFYQVVYTSPEANLLAQDED